MNLNFIGMYNVTCLIALFFCEICTLCTQAALYVVSIDKADVLCYYFYTIIFGRNLLNEKDT